MCLVKCDCCQKEHLNRVVSCMKCFDKLQRKAALADERLKIMEGMSARIQELTILADELAAALQRVEWVYLSNPTYIGCPWCANLKKDGHALACSRQAALAEYEVQKQGG